MDSGDMHECVSGKRFPSGNKIGPGTKRQCPQCQAAKRAKKAGRASRLADLEAENESLREVLDHLRKTGMMHMPSQCPVCKEHRAGEGR